MAAIEMGPVTNLNPLTAVLVDSCEHGGVSIGGGGEESRASRPEAGDEPSLLEEVRSNKVYLMTFH